MTISNCTDSSFESEVLNSKTPVLVDFWAPWCGPCKQIAPSLEAIAAERDDIQIVKINVDENPTSPARFGVRGIPALFLVKEGKVLGARTGALPQALIEEWIESTI